MSRQSIPAIFKEQVAKFRSRPMVYAKRGGHWSPLTWAQAGERVANAAAGLCVLGVKPGDIVSLLSENSPEWMLADFATLCAGAADAPIYATNTAEQCAYVVRDSGSKIVFASSQEQVDKLAAARAEMPDATHVVYFEELTPPKVLGLTFMSLAELEALGRDKGDAEEVNRRIAATEPDALLTLIYTSGTTGEPKGVMLTHHAMISNCEATMRGVDFGPDDVLVSFLPLSHSFERMGGYYLSLLFAGATIYYAESIPKLVANIGEVKPTVMLAVPRIYEKVYGGFMAQRDEATGLKRTLMDWSIAVGEQVSALRQSGKEPGGLLALKYKIAYKLVFSKLNARLGGRIRFFVSGGAPLSGEIAKFFHAANLLVLEGYGLSETAPVLTVNRPNAYKFGSVGKVLDNVEIKIAEDGEILARGPNIMTGYYNKPEASAEVLLADGWFATGDIGEFDAEGFLRITDRKKDLFKTAGGKYVAPQHVENLLKLERYVEQVCLVGDQRPYCIALIVPAFEELDKWAAANGADVKDPAKLVEHPEVKKLIAANVAHVNASLPQYEQVKYYHVISDPFSVENGFLTPSMKVKRKAVIKAFVKEIDAVYAAGAKKAPARD